MENFTIFKNTYKQKENQPDYKVSVKNGDNYEEWGACWKKQGNNGAYLSCTKSKPMTPTQDIRDTKDYPKEDEIDANDIPF